MTAMYWTAMYWPYFPTYTYHSPIDALYEGIPSSDRVLILYEKTRMAGLQSGEGCMMIDSDVWAQRINVTDIQTDSHVSIANALRRAAKTEPAVLCNFALISTILDRSRQNKICGSLTDDQNLAKMN